MKKVPVWLIFPFVFVGGGVVVVPPVTVARVEVAPWVLTRF
ncbi:hypothetical protein [Carnobacterium maltaromaticum]|nr:hypothetical protein [Carnobacterium maltaromaticum]